MKSLKKILSIFAAFMMVVGLTAANVKAESGNTGTITVTDPKQEQYTAYQLFTATTNGTSTVYEASQDQFNFFGGNDSTLFTFTQNTKGTWNVKKNDATTAADIIKYIQAEGRTLSNLPSIQLEEDTDDDGKTIFTKTNVALGYYYITSGTGTVGMLDTAGTELTVEDKNDINFHKTSTSAAETVVDKQVGDTVPFTITFNIYTGWKDVVLIDTMTSGLALDGNITVTGIDATQYTLVTGTPANGFTLTIPTVSENATVTVTYNGKVQDGANYQEVATNTAKLNEGNNPNLVPDQEVNVYTYKLVVDKYDSKDSTKKLSGATFQIYDQDPDATGSTAQPLHFEVVNGEYVLTTKSVSTEDPKTVFDSVVTDTNGALTVKGLSNQTYWVKETVAPDGYNLMVGTKTFTPSVSGVVQDASQKLDVPNDTGTTLPSTGGMGTTMLYVAGAILMVGAAIIFVTNKRMKHE